jgi:hypothetical protein
VLLLPDFCDPYHSRTIFWTLGAADVCQQTGWRTVVQLLRVLRGLVGGGSYSAAAVRHCDKKLIAEVDPPEVVLVNRRRFVVDDLDELAAWMRLVTGEQDLRVVGCDRPIVSVQYLLGRESALTRRICESEVPQAHRRSIGFCDRFKIRTMASNTGRRSKGCPGAARQTR